jgi:hypothetical protein
MSGTVRRALGLSVALATVVIARTAAAQDAPPLPPPPPPAAPPAEPSPPPVQVQPAPYYEPPAAPPQYAPPPPVPRPVPRGETTRFETDDADVALMMKTGEMPYRHVERFRRVWYVERGFTPAYSPICEGPCTTALAPGEYHLALSKAGGRAVPAGAVVLNGPSTIHGYYEDHSAERILGGVLVVGGIVGGIVMIVVSASDATCDSDTGECSQTVNGPLLAGGIGTIIGGAIIGGILAAQKDTAHIMVTPLGMVGVGAQKETPMAALNAEPPPQGLAFGVKF